MGITFSIIAVVVIAGSVAAISLRNLVHCALALTATFAGLAALYLQLDAQFVGLAQILVYIGAVSILVVFAILLTRGGQAPEQRIFISAWPAGVAIAIVMLGVLVWAVMKSGVSHRELPAQPVVTVHQIGDALMNKFVLPLEVIGLLLTAALIGAVIIAMHDKEEKK
jgi:NADH:ubiquinone oxidoreductase subunit 6 (subunit J)